MKTKNIKKMLYSMLIVLSLIFTMVFAATVSADTPATETPQSETQQPTTETPQTETPQTETETEVTIGFKEPVAYVIKGQKMKLKPVGLSGKLRWKSSKKKVATVNKKGVVTAKKRGKSKITVYAGNVPYTCKLIVEEPSISKQTVAVLKGATYQLEMEGTAQKIKWKTSNKKIAEVDEEGLVTAKKKGTVTITAKIGKTKYKCKVTVEKPKLSNKTLTIKCGDKGNLFVKGTIQKVKWKSKDKSIATVDKGVVTSKKIGTTTIEAKIGKKVMTCEINVIDNPITSIKINKDEITLETGKETQLKAKIKPANTSHSKKIKWSSSDKAVAKVSKKGVVTAVGVGTATIKAEAGGKTDTCKVIVKPSMGMKYSQIISYVQTNGKPNAEGDMTVTTTNNGATASIEVDKNTGRLMFGYAYSGEYNTTKLSMVVDVLKNGNVSPTIWYSTADQKTEYQAAATVAAATIQKGAKLKWKLFNSSTKVQEGAIQTNCNSKFKAAMAEWQSILNACTGYNLADIGFNAYK